MQVRQIAGMRGLVANPRGEIIPRPIKANFREGLSVLEYFISTHGARKGLADTALRTADSGYLTRRLVDVAQELIVREIDCETTSWHLGRGRARRPRELAPARDEPARPLPGRGRHARRRHGDPAQHRARRRRRCDLLADDPASTACACARCSRARRSSVCARAATARMLATGKIADLGEAIGIVAAQSIGEPGTQLTMRTFHTGGVAGEDITHGLPRVVELFEARTPEGRGAARRRARVSSASARTRRASARSRSSTDDGEELEYVGVAPRCTSRCVDGQEVQAGDRLVGDDEEPARPEEAARDQGRPRDAAVPGRRGAAGVPRPGRVDPRQAHRGDRPADAAPGRPCSEPGDSAFLPGEKVDAAALRRGEPPPRRGGQASGRGSSRAHGNHEGVARDRLVAVGGVVPGDHPGAHRGGDRGPFRRARGPQGERDHRQAHPGRYGHAAVPRHPDAWRPTTSRCRSTRPSRRRDRPRDWLRDTLEPVPRTTPPDFAHPARPSGPAATGVERRRPGGGRSHRRRLTQEPFAAG